MSKGLLHIYCGDGKGKTTAATGLAIRCAGSGRKVLFVRFLKNDKSSELKILETIDGMDVLNPDKEFGFYNKLTENQKAEIKQVYSAYWSKVMDMVEQNDYDMLVIDEFISAYNHNIINQNDALNYLKSRNEQLEVVLTGRDPKEALIDIADYVSAIKKEKHPFDEGIGARIGVEF